MKTSREESSGEETEVVTPRDAEDQKEAGFKKRAELVERSEIERIVGEDRPKKEAKRQHLAEERQGGYVIVYQRAGRGTLHMLGPSSCWMARKRSFTKSEVFKECPEAESYSTWCTLCWREEAKKAAESTSDSCDELDFSDVTDS